MKILWFAHRDMENPNSGGAEKTIEEVSKRLVSYGHELHLFSVAWKNSPLESNFEGVNIHRVSGNVYSHLIHCNLLKKYADADVIVDDLGHVVPWISNRLTNIPGVALFRHLHQRTLSGQIDPFRARILKYMEKKYKWFYPNWDFVTESNVPANDLVSLGIERNRIHIVKPGITLGKFRCEDRPDLRQLIYFAGMRKYKRADHAIMAFGHLLEKYKDYEDLKLIMVGSGPVLAELKALSEKYVIRDRIIFTGRLSETALIKRIKESAVNVHCSVEEGWCYSPLEAMACGVPTAAYYNNGLTDEILEGITGSFATDGDIESLSESIKNILDHFDNYSKNCCSISRSYSWDYSAKQWEELLEKIIDQST
jgi:glycosyltransferase involved in cell wall biosynthesis